MGPRGADESSRVSWSLPVIDEEASQSSPEIMVMASDGAERRKAVVSGMRELLRRAAAAQSARTKLRRSTVATAKKWKRVVGRIQNRGVVTLQGDSRTSSSVSSISSKQQSSFSPAATSIVRISSGSDDETRMAHWVTTDSDFVVLEL